LLTKLQTTTEKHDIVFKLKAAGLHQTCC